MKKMTKLMLAVVLVGGFMETASAAVPAVPVAAVLSNEAAVVSQVSQLSTDWLKGLSLDQMKQASGWGVQIAFALKGLVSSLNDGVSATTDQIYKFLATPVGKITLGIIVYKVVGNEIVHVLLGIVLLIILFTVFTKWSNYFFKEKRTLKTEEGKLKTYDNTPSLFSGFGNDEKILIVVVHAIILVLLTMLTVSFMIP